MRSKCHNDKKNYQTGLTEGRVKNRGLESKGELETVKKVRTSVSMDVNTLISRQVI
jgi:hypothetical protein